MRVFDALFNEGPKILYRVALALLKLEEETLLKFDNAGEGIDPSSSAVQCVNLQCGLCLLPSQGRVFKTTPPCLFFAGDIVMHMRKFASSMYNRDKLMSIAFDGIGSLPMSTIDKYREMRARDFAASGKALLWFVCHGHFNCS